MAVGINAIEQVSGKEPLKWELTDIFREYGQTYREKYKPSFSQLKVMQAVEFCRTARMGGHMYKCNNCGYEHPVYSSCGNRHCPRCQTLAKIKWLEARKAELLPVPYFHNVFTLPHELNTLARCNQKIIYDLLFNSASQTLLKFGYNPENNLGGQMGFLSVLHTWDQKLLEHVHVHCIIPAGALSAYKKSWLHLPRPDFLFPVKALSKSFKGHFINSLEKAFVQDKFTFAGQCAELKAQGSFQILIDNLWQKDWVVYSKKPFAGPEQVLEYLGRYTHRVAISNNRIKKVQNGNVTFTWRDRRDNNKNKEMILPVEEFIRRFLLHIVPDSYMRIRHFGFLSNKHRTKNISLCRKLLGVSVQPKKEEQSLEEIMFTLTGEDITKCPRCKKGKMLVCRELLKDKIYYDKPKQINTS